MSASGRVFASHYQLMLTDDPTRVYDEATNWGSTGASRWVAGDVRSRLFPTEADLNDHWCELSRAASPPTLEAFQRVIAFGWRSETGWAHVMSVIDNEASVSLPVAPGDYAVFACASNLGVDTLSRGETDRPTDIELAERTDLERYHLVLVPGVPMRTGLVYERKEP